MRLKVVYRVGALRCALPHPSARPRPTKKNVSAHEPQAPRLFANWAGAPEIGVEHIKNSRASPATKSLAPPPLKILRLHIWFKGGGFETNSPS